MSYLANKHARELKPGDIIVRNVHGNKVFHKVSLVLPSRLILKEVKPDIDATRMFMPDGYTVDDIEWVNTDASPEAWFDLDHIVSTAEPNLKWEEEVALTSRKFPEKSLDATSGP